MDTTSYTKEFKPSNIESEYHKLVDYNASKGYDDWDLTYKQEFDDTTEVTKKAFEEWISKKGGGITGYKGDYESPEEKKKYEKKIKDFFKKMLEMDVPKKKSKKIDKWEDSDFFDDEEEVEKKPKKIIEDEKSPKKIDRVFDFNED